MEYKLAVGIATQGRRPNYLHQALSSVFGGKTSNSEVAVILVGPEGAVPHDFVNHPDLIFVYADAHTPAPRKLNYALHAARDKSEFFSFLSDDDLLFPGNMLASLSNFDANPEHVLVFGDCSYIDEAGNTLALNQLGHLASMGFSHLPQRIPQPSTIFRTREAIMIGGFSEAFQKAYDFDLFLRLGRVGTFAYSSNLLASWRFHENSLTVSGRWDSAAEASRARQNLRRPLPRTILAVVELAITAATFGAGKLFDRSLRRKSNKMKSHKGA